MNIVIELSTLRALAAEAGLTAEAGVRKDPATMRSLFEVNP